MTYRSSIDYIVIGQIIRQTIVPLNGKVYERILGGPALYAAAGLKSCVENIGVISAIPVNEKEELEQVSKKYKIDFFNQTLSTSSPLNEQFLGYLSPNDPPSQQPIPYFSSMKMTLPLSMRLDAFQTNTQNQKFFSPTLSPNYLNATAAHICAADLQYQVKACTLIDKSAISVFTILSDPSYMIPSEWDMVMNLMNGLTIFVTSQDQLVSLFKNRTDDIQEIGRILHAHGCAYLVTIKCAKGYTLYDFEKESCFQIPVYPSPIVDPTGVQEAFCGGLLAEMRHSHDPLQAVIRGSVLASIKAEGCGPFFPLEATPGLIDARMQRIKDWVKSS